MKYNQFAGRLAFDADLSKFKQAVSMSLTGSSRDEIWLSTGYFKDLDGRWKWEIPDSDAELKNGWRDKINSGDICHLSEILDHPLLYSNYPQLQRYVVQKADIGEASGSFSWWNNSISLSEKLLSESNDAEWFGTICHEIGHAIQVIEDFGYGMNGSEGMKNKYITAVKDHLSGLQSKINEWRNDNFYEVEYRHSYVSDILRDIRVYKARNSLAGFASSSTPTSYYSQAIKNIESLLRYAKVNEEHIKKIHYLAMLVPKSNYGGKRSDAIRALCAAAITYANEYLSETKLKNIESIENIQAYESSLVIEIESLNVLKKDIGDMNASKNKALQVIEHASSLSPTQLYYWSLGEVSARSISNRAQLSHDELLTNHPINGYDVAEEDIFAFWLNNRADFIVETNDYLDYQLVEGRAFIDFGGESFAHMVLTPFADASSVIHESAHYYLEIFSALNLRDCPSSVIKDDFKAILDWMELSEKEWYALDDSSKEIYHERFSEAYENWVLNNNHSQLSNVFARFREWMIEIFSGARKVELTSCDGLESLFEKMAKGGDSRPTTVFEKSVYEAISKDLGEEVADATKRLNDRSMAYFEKVSGIPRTELGRQFDLNISNVEREKPKFSNQIK